MKFIVALTCGTSRFCKLVHTDENNGYTLFLLDLIYSLVKYINSQKPVKSPYIVLYDTFPSHYDKTSINNNVCDNTPLLISTNVTFSEKKYQQYKSL